MFAINTHALKRDVYRQGVSQLSKKVEAAQITSVDFILFLFSDNYWEIDSILIYLIKYSQILPWKIERKFFCVKTYYETKSFIIVRTRYKRKFNFNTFPNRSQIFKLIKNVEAHGACEGYRATGSSPITQKECAREQWAPGTYILVLLIFLVHIWDKMPCRS